MQTVTKFSTKISYSPGTAIAVHFLTEELAAEVFGDETESLKIPSREAIEDWKRERKFEVDVFDDGSLRVLIKGSDDNAVIAIIKDLLATFGPDAVLYLDIQGPFKSLLLTRPFSGLTKNFSVNLWDVSLACHLLTSLPNPII